MSFLAVGVLYYHSIRLVVASRSPGICDTLSLTIYFALSRMFTGTHFDLGVNEQFFWVTSLTLDRTLYRRFARAHHTYTMFVGEDAQLPSPTGQSPTTSVVFRVVSHSFFKCWSCTACAVQQEDSELTP